MSAKDKQEYKKRYTENIIKKIEKDTVYIRNGSK